MSALAWTLLLPWIVAVITLIGIIICAIILIRSGRKR